MSAQKNCLTLFADAKLAFVKYQELKKEFDQLPKGASDETLIPNNPSAQLDREKATNLEKQMTYFIIQADENLSEYEDRCSLKL